MKKTMTMLLAALLSGLLLSGCGASGAQTSAPAQSPETKTDFTIGCMPLNEPAVQALSDLMKPLGYNMEVVVFDGNSLPAIALKDGDIDGLILNHLPWINTFNQENQSELVMVEPYLYASLFGLYSSKYDSVEAIPDRATITISNDPSNMQRSLELLQQVGLITLGEKTDEFYTTLDIAENPKEIAFLEVETTATASSYQDADATISFTSVMRNAGIDPYSYLAQDGKYVDYPTGLVVNTGSEGEQWVKDALEVAQTDAFKDQFNEIFQGAYILFADMD